MEWSLLTRESTVNTIILSSSLPLLDLCKSTDQAWYPKEAGDWCYHACGAPPLPATTTSDQQSEHPCCCKGSLNLHALVGSQCCRMKSLECSHRKLQSQTAKERQKRQSSTAWGYSLQHWGSKYSCMEVTSISISYIFGLLLVYCILCNDMKLEETYWNSQAPS